MNEKMTRAMDWNSYAEIIPTNHDDLIVWDFPAHDWTRYLHGRDITRLILMRGEEDAAEVVLDTTHPLVIEMYETDADNARIAVEQEDGFVDDGFGAVDGWVDAALVDALNAVHVCQNCGSTRGGLFNNTWFCYGCYAKAGMKQEDMEETKS